MARYLALLGSADGPRVDLLAQTAVRLADASGGSIIETSSVYAERKNEGLKGIYANVVIVIDAQSVPSKDAIRAVEASLGRIRDPERNIPHTVDIDVLAWTDETGRLILSDRKDLGGSYALFGAYAIEDRAVRAAVQSLMTERGIEDADVGRWFYPLASRELFGSIIRLA
jgi:7,8-dihydro-6-hydroxymethylpterin-pyrophosphokinase